jgi:ribose transport system ATP-binding protein
VGGCGLNSAVRLRHISKSFGGVRALDGAHLEVLRGEVHGLLGENGSGKSTLIKVLAGYHDPEPGGELEVGGRAARLPLRPGEARTLGLAFVHQDLGLIPSLSVVENLRLTELAARRGWRISWSGERRRAAEALARHGVAIDPHAVVAELHPLDRALLAIVRAMEDLGASGGLLVLDEPTAFLPSAEAERLFALMRSIAQAGTSVVFVSHDLEEARRITDRVTVLRDGRTVGTVVSGETATEEFAAMILGGTPAASTPARATTRAAEAFVSVAGLRGEILDGLSFEVGRGEVLGVTGLAGSGFEELPYLLFGASRAAAGRLELAGVPYDLTSMTPAAALDARIVLVPSDRARDGAVGSLSLAENLMLPALDRFRAGLRLERGRMVAAAGELLRRFGVRPSEPHMPYESLSGGNQQKALLAKWLQTRPSLLLLDEPTRGVDVGARPHIWALIRAAADDGAAVICASSDSEELATLCDRVLST